MPTKPQAHRPHQTKRQPERRPSSCARGYGYRWQQASKAFLAAHPLCAECERQGEVTAATVVDHIRPHRGDMTVFWDSDNWQPLCKRCHDQKTARHDGAFGRQSKHQ